MPGAAARTIVVTYCRPHIHPFVVAAVALVEVPKEGLCFHGRFSTLKALNSETVIGSLS